MPEPPDGCSKKAKTLQWTYRDWLVIVAVFYLALVWGLYLYGDKVHPALPSIASALIILSLIINFKWKNPEEKSGKRVTYALFASAVFLSFMIYALPNIRLSENLQPYSDQNQDILAENQALQALGTCRGGKLKILEVDSKSSLKSFEVKLELNADTKEFIKEQYATAVEEIQARIQIDDFWFNNKFILVGALFASFIVFISPLFNPDIKKEQFNGISGWPVWERNISRMFKTPLPSSILGMACIVSFAVDLHMRNNMMMTQQLGLWIRDFVECLLIPEGAYIGWERFLRINLETDNRNIEGLHVQFLFAVLDASHFFFTSIVLYSLYIFCLQGLSRCFR